jgi:hypothetical protein
MLMGASLNPIKIADPGAVKAPGNTGELVSQLDHCNPVFQSGQRFTCSNKTGRGCSGNRGATTGQGSVFTGITLNQTGIKQVTEEQRNRP